MGILKSLTEDPGYLKAGLQGMQGAGKTFTAALLAIGTRKYFDLKGPIAMFDTESGSSYIRKMIQEETDQDLVGVRSRALSQLIQVGKECVSEGVSVLIADSMTHVWREVCAAYLAKVNEGRKKRHLPRRFSLEFQDWGPIKEKFAEWTDFYINSPLHIIICGRLGFEWDWHVNEETDKRELIKSGTKMKTETELGYEPSLLIEMFQDRPSGKNGFDSKILHKGIVLKDRFHRMDGKALTNPKFEDFLPHIEQLAPGSNPSVDIESKTDFDGDLTGDMDYAASKKRKTILCEEIEGALTEVFPTQSNDHKNAKRKIIQLVFETHSWTRVQALSEKKLKDGLARILDLLKDNEKLADVV